MRRRIYAVGSSPLVRGARYRREGGAIHCGIIPARAGSTGSRTGSSPLVRGARRQTCRGSSDGRIIPARAGSTPRSCIRLAAVRDHPRSCGEHAGSPPEALGRPGSSPLVRGAPALRGGPFPAPGIIPARAGSTRLSGWRCRRFWDHPRSCGEHRMECASVACCEGSSPLVRGAL